MNESALIIADFSYVIEGKVQDIDYQYFDFEKLYQQVSVGRDKNCFCLRTSRPESVFKEILRKVTFIKAAGGLVKNGEGSYLFIKRLGKWDLPKGKVEKGEKMEDAATREVEEECGIHIDRLGLKLSSTYHSYIMKGELLIKKTNWYAMSVYGVPALIPQLTEDITEARWLKADELSPVRENTYPLILELIKAL